MIKLIIKEIQNIYLLFMYLCITNLLKICNDLWHTFNYFFHFI